MTTVIRPHRIHQGLYILLQQEVNIITAVLVMEALILQQRWNMLKIVDILPVASVLAEKL